MKAMKVVIVCGNDMKEIWKWRRNEVMKIVIM